MKDGDRSRVAIPHFGTAKDRSEGLATIKFHVRDSCAPFGSALRGRREIGKFGPAGLILIYTKHEKPLLGNASLQRRTDLDR